MCEVNRISFGRTIIISSHHSRNAANESDCRIDPAFGQRSVFRLWCLENQAKLDRDARAFNLPRAVHCGLQLGRRTHELLRLAKSATIFALAPKIPQRKQGTRCGGRGGDGRFHPPHPPCSPSHPSQWPLPTVILLVTCLPRLPLVKKFLQRSSKPGLWGSVEGLWGRGLKALRRPSKEVACMGCCIAGRGPCSWEAQKLRCCPGERDEQEKIPDMGPCRERISIYEGCSWAGPVVLPQRDSECSG